MAGHRLDPLFNFSSVAVVGASESSSYGAGAYLTLRDLQFDGRYYPINPRRDQVHGIKAYPSVADLPESIECAMLVIGRERVPEALQACAERGARAAVIVSAGFAEADELGAELQRQVKQIAQEHDLLLIGPNCFGVASVVNRCGAFTGSGLGESVVGNVGVISNSGGLLNEIISYGNARGIGFSHLASTGNEVGLTAADLLDYYVEDPNTEVVIGILEAVRDPAGFVRAADKAAVAGKPIVLVKLGSSAKAAQSALTHTGALSGSDEVFDALVRQKGLIRVHDVDELIEVGALLSGAVPVLRRRPLERAAIIEISGGGKGLLCDTAAAAGLELPDFSDEAARIFEPLVPIGTTSANPLDTGATWTVPEMDTSFPLILKTLATEPQIDMVVARFTVPRNGPIGRLQKRVDELLEARAANPDRLFTVLSRSADRFSDEWHQLIRETGLVFGQGYGRGVQALGRLAAYSRFLRRQAERREVGGRPHLPALPALPTDRSALDEVEAKDLLRVAGLPVVATGLAATADQAVELAETYGYPVALKVVAPEILHKSDVGGVRLGLIDAGAVRRAFEELQQVAATQGARFEGVAVQPMAKPGLELVLGANRDPQFGPVLLFGLGGIFVETLKDVALRVAPITKADAAEMLDEIRASAVLKGARGQAAVDRDALTRALVVLSELMLAEPRIESIDLNPVFGYADGIQAVDARIILSDGDGSERA